MAHLHQRQFVAALKSRIPVYFSKNKVLEIGSLDINGSLRDFFVDCDYCGLDVGPGKGVDIVCEGQKYDAPDNTYDVVSSAECFEHNPYWLETFINMIRLCRNGGLVFFTCATEGRAEHGTSRTTMLDSPLTIQKGWDYYRNLTESDFTNNIILDDYFSHYTFEVNHESHDLYFWGIVSKHKKKLSMKQFVKEVILAGGSIKPLIIDSTHTGGTGLFNPTIFNDNGKLIANIRHCQYTIYHSEKNIYEHEWGPLVYLHPENDQTLTTTNWYCELNDELDITYSKKVDTTKLDVKPIWEFVGLEDVRITKWDDKIFYSGVRRDTTTNGVGRMELSEIVLEDNSPKEISRQRLPAPNDNNSYCEKNWMPINDMPYHYVKWSNPTEVVKYDPENKTTEQVFLGSYVSKPYDFRGGSQVIRWKDYRICLSHSTNLYNSESGRKNADYWHSFIVWDKDWNVVKYTDLFNFMGAKIEFSCGMCEYRGDMIITFGYQDNSAYVLRVPGEFFNRWLDV